MNVFESIQNKVPLSMKINYALSKFEYMKMIKERRNEHFDQLNNY